MTTNPTPSIAQAAGEPVAWQYENQHGNPFLTHKDPSTWHPHDRAGFKNFVALGAIAAPTPSASSVPVDWQHRCAVLVDIYDDDRNNAPEDRCYVDGAFTAEMDEVRALLAANAQADICDYPFEDSVRALEEAKVQADVPDAIEAMFYTARNNTLAEFKKRVLAFNAKAPSVPHPDEIMHLGLKCMGHWTSETREFSRQLIALLQANGSTK